MPDRVRGDGSHFPPYLAGRRKAAFLFLILLAVSETGAQIWTGQALSAAIRATVDPALAILSLVAAVGLFACVFWMRSVLAEWIGQNYVNDVRAGLAHQAVASAMGRGRLGTITARMSADLAALKNWSDAGVCGVVSGLLTFVAGLVSALTIAGINGLLSCLLGPAITLVLVAALYWPLSTQIRLRRAARGLLAARTGDAVFSTRTAAVYHVLGQLIRPIHKAGERLAKTSVSVQSKVQLLRASATAVLPCGVLAFIFLEAGSSVVSASVWAGLMYALGLASAGVALLVLAVEALIERRIAIDKLRELDAQAREAPKIAPEGATRIPYRPILPLTVESQLLCPPGESVEISRLEHPRLVDRLMKGDAAVHLGDVPSPAADPRDWGRRVAIVSERIPLKRGGLREVVRVRGRPSQKLLEKALRVAGLDAEHSGLPSVIDPQKHLIEPRDFARLRLARALLSNPHAIVIDEPWLVSDSDLKVRVNAWGRKTGAAVLWLS